MKKMNEWFKIAGFLLLLLLLTAEDCSNTVSVPSGEEQMSELFLDMENNFEKEQLKPEDLVAFENRALQMLSDLVDYINICADSSLSSEFRHQSRQMIKSFFINDSGVDSLLLEMKLVEDRKKGIILFNTSEPFQLKLESSEIIEKFVMQYDLTYSGKLKFNLSSNLSDLDPRENEIAIYLKKSKKKFGDKSMNVWGVFLGG